MQTTDNKYQHVYYNEEKKEHINHMTQHTAIKITLKCSEYNNGMNKWSIDDDLWKF